MDKKPLSPIDEGEEKVTMTFPDAIRELTLGKNIARLSWSPAGSYGLLKDGFLMLWIDGQFKKWIVNDGDLMGDDWIVVHGAN